MFCGGVGSGVYAIEHSSAKSDIHVVLSKCVSLYLTVFFCCHCLTLCNYCLVAKFTVLGPPSVPVLEEEKVNNIALIYGPFL